MSENKFPPRVTQGEDGVYRWSYDLDMYQNPYLRNVVLKIAGILCLVLYLLTLTLFSQDGLSLRIALILGLVYLGVVLLAAAIYYICAAVMHGNYHLQFEMDENAIVLIRKESTQRFMNLVSDAAVMMDRRVGHNLQSAAQSGYTEYKQVRAMTPRPQYDAINLRELTGANQIWIPREDYDFVREYIWTHLTDKARKRSGNGSSRRLTLALALSAALNLAVMLINLVHYNRTYNLLIYRSTQGWAHAVQQSVGMRNIMTGFRGGGVVEYELLLFWIPFLACALILYLVFTLLHRRKE